MHKSNTDVSAYSWTCWEEIAFNQKLVSIHQILSFENSHLGEKRRSKVVRTFQNCWVWGAETFSDQSKTQTSCEMAVLI